MKEQFSFLSATVLFLKQPKKPIVQSEDKFLPIKMVIFILIYPNDFLVLFDFEHSHPIFPITYIETVQKVECLRLFLHILLLISFIQIIRFKKPWLHILRKLSSYSLK